MNIFPFIISLLIMIVILKIMNYNIGSFIVVKIIQLLHLLLCLFIIFGPFFINNKDTLIIYIVLVSFIILHWILSSDVCALTLLEQYITGESSDYTFVGRLVKPVYNITNRHIIIITVGLLLFAIIKLLIIKY